MDCVSKWVVFTSSCISLPVIHSLKLQNRLAGVVTVSDQFFSKNVPSQVTDLQQLHQQLNQLAVPVTILDSDTHLLASLDKWQASSGIVFSFPKKLSQTVIDFLDGQIFNLHASDLPRYRGPNPVYWQLRDNLTSTQLTIHRLSEQMDAGDIGYQLPVAIHPFDNFQTLNLRIMEMAPHAMNTFIQQWDRRGIEWLPQQGEVSFAPRLNEDDARLEWGTHSVEDYVGVARAGNPHHGGVAIGLSTIAFNLLQVSVSEQPTFGSEPGTVLAVDKQKGLIVAVKNGAISLDIIASQSGYYSGYQFATFHHIEAGMILK